MYAAIRQYEEIKLGNVERFRAHAATLRDRIARGEAGPPPRLNAELPITPV